MRRKSNEAGHYSHVVQRELEASALLLKDEELKLPDDLDYFRYPPIETVFDQRARLVN